MFVELLSRYHCLVITSYNFNLGDLGFDVCLNYFIPPMLYIVICFITFHSGVSS